MRSVLFLLGGQDLEMHTIKDILSSYGCNFIDLCLKWSDAKLSKYKQYIDSFLAEHSHAVIYGIELEEDLFISQEIYVPIDHHNGSSDKPSALEQVLDLLNIKKTRYYELVAANDRFYIPGMKAIGATDLEIKTIRMADRKAQGITEEDEFLAKKSIKDNLEEINSLMIVRSYSSVFTPISDALYPYTSLLIYNAFEFTYYGSESYRIKELFSYESSKDKIYYGGGVNGYIGSKYKAYSENEICQIVKLIKDEFV